jgi:hypothetical protein
MNERPLPPPLEFPFPPCSVCGEDCDHDGASFCCLNCNCSWPSKSPHLDEGEWDEDDEEQCDATDQPYLNSEHKSVKEKTFRCIRTKGHGGEHSDPTGWTMHSWESPTKKQPAVTVELPGGDER